MQLFSDSLTESIVLLKYITKSNLSFKQLINISSIIIITRLPYFATGYYG